MKDPAGNSQWIATHIEDVSSEDLARRGKAAAEERRKSWNRDDSTVTSARRGVVFSGVSA